MTREERLVQVARERQRGLLVVLEDIHDPHNASAIMRTCDALGIQDVWLIFEREKAWNPRRVGKASSSSANKWLTFRTFKTTAECIAALEEERYVSVGAFMDGETEIRDLRFDERGKLALWVGNEHRGLSEEARAAVAETVRIPMRGFVESLNVSVATALMLYEITCRWNQPYSDEEVQALAHEWLKR